MTVLVDMPEAEIVRLQLCRPEKRNALNGDLVRDFSVALDNVAKNKQVRILMITAAGKDFCAGADLEWMKKMSGCTDSENTEDAKSLAALFQRIYVQPIPVVSLVQGAVFGGGIGILAASDIVIASKSAQFSFPETQMGITPSVVSPWVIAALGARLAQYYFLTGNVISADQAQLFGLIHHVVADSDLELVGMKLAKKILRASPGALIETKALLRQIVKGAPSLELQNLTACHLARMRQLPDAKEGLAAFLEKRQPVWGKSE